MCQSLSIVLCLPYNKCTRAFACAVLCCAVPCRAVPCRAVPCRAVPCRAVLCCAVLQQQQPVLINHNSIKQEHDVLQLLTQQEHCYLVLLTATGGMALRDEQPTAPSSLQLPSVHTQMPSTQLSSATAQMPSAQPASATTQIPPAQQLSATAEDVASPQHPLSTAKLAAAQVPASQARTLTFCDAIKHVNECCCLCVSRVAGRQQPTIHVQVGHHSKKPS